MSAKKKNTQEAKATSKTLYLIRHGQSLANRDYAESADYRDAELTEQGIAQARALQKELEEVQLDLAVVSPLTRALQTCQNALPSSYTGPVLVLPDITEICSSHYSCGQLRKAVQPKFPERFDWSHVPMDEAWWWRFDQKPRPEPAVSHSERMERFRQFIRARPEERIAVFSHGDYLWDFLDGQGSYLANCQVRIYKM